MNREELNDEFNRKENNAPKQLKPLRKLKKIDNTPKPSEPEYHGLHEAPQIDIPIAGEKPVHHEEKPQQVYHGLHEKGTKGDLVESGDYYDDEDYER